MKTGVKYILLGAAVAAVTAGTLHFVNQKNEKTEVPVPQTITTGSPQGKPAVTTGLEAVNITQQAYEVYRPDGQDFAFVIADLHVKGNEAINIPLSHFTTSEGIELDQVDSYVQALENSRYYLGKKNVWYSLVSEKNETDVNIFIPVKDTNAKEITLKWDFGTDNSADFDLTKNLNDISELYYASQDVISDGKTYQMKVSNAFEITGDTLLDQNDNEYIVPSTARVFLFKVDAVSLWGDTVTVESASFESDSFSGQADGSIHSLKYENMISKPITDSQSGYLFFVTLDPDHDLKLGNGLLHLELAGQDTPIDINVSLQ